MGKQNAFSMNVEIILKKQAQIAEIIMLQYTGIYSWLALALAMQSQYPGYTSIRLPRCQPTPLHCE